MRTYIIPGIQVPKIWTYNPIIGHFFQNVNIYPKSGHIFQFLDIFSKMWTYIPKGGYMFRKVDIFFFKMWTYILKLIDKYKMKNLTFPFWLQSRITDILIRYSRVHYFLIYHNIASTTIVSIFSASTAHNRGASQIDCWFALSCSFHDGSSLLKVLFIKSSPLPM